MYLTRKQKEELVIDLKFNENKTYRYIAREVGPVEANVQQECRNECESNKKEEQR